MKHEKWNMKNEKWRMKNEEWKIIQTPIPEELHVYRKDQILIEQLICFYQLLLIVFWDLRELSIFAKDFSIVWQRMIKLSATNLCVGTIPK